MSTHTKPTTRRLPARAGRQPGRQVIPTQDAIAVAEQLLLEGGLAFEVLETTAGPGSPAVPDQGAPGHAVRTAPWFGGRRLAA